MQTYIATLRWIESSEYLNSSSYGTIHPYKHIKSVRSRQNVNKDEELGRFLDDALVKGYIILSKSPMVSLVFFVKKKDGKLHFVQDYHKLNMVTIKNRYPLLLASDIINHLTKAKIFTKFNVRWSYNNIWIKEANQ